MIPVALLLLAGGISFVLLFGVNRMYDFLNEGSQKQLRYLRIFVPFAFNHPIDPRRIRTVGDQVICEHVFGFHAHLTTVESGFQDLLSEIRFFPERSEVTLRPRYELRRADGTIYAFENFCRSLKESLRGTQHAPYGDILKEIICDQSGHLVRAKFERIPINLRFLFTLPDFALSDPTDLPLTENTRLRTTGPYFVEQIKSGSVLLRRNPYYPRELISNTIESVEVNNYPASAARDMLSGATPSSHHAIYIAGHSILSSDLEMLRVKGYKTNISPTEWVIHLSLKNSIPMNVRKEVSEFVEQFQKSEVFKSYLASLAYSISPLDRGYSISESEVKLLKNELFREQPEEDDLRKKRNLKLRFVSSLRLSGSPFVKGFISHFKERFPEFEIATDPSGKPPYEGDVVLYSLGISPADPLNHFAYLANMLPGFQDVVSLKEIAEAAMIVDPEEFYKKVKGFEFRALRSGLVLPIAHFPGVVALRSDLSINDAQSFGWGIQAWSLKQD